MRETLLPTWPTGHEAWAGLVAILGAAISPYLFFWQASLELEEKARSRSGGALRGTRREDETNERAQTGITNIETSHDAAAVLMPLAGAFAATLFTVGIVGAGLVAIPTLVTSAAYALAETFRWKNGLNKTFKAARPFYSVIILSSIIGIALDFADVSPMKALYWAAVVNGVLAPFLLIGILIVASDRKIMRQHASSLLARLTVGVTALAMLGAAIGMFVF